ncbi:hypothetical protein TRIUR3_31687 [Triticum urartu]|uniref:Uncharacterized protein n=1 Tax=Triticum urartu TaxID=4572 RepID=M7ZDW9_TRIUA|nr:hypothetical protein TRIUR3_31687 [Triticum urartu]
MATGSHGSWRSNETPMIPSPVYTCSFCPRTFTNLQARGGHMTKHRQEVLENRRKHEEYMTKKAKEFSMEPLSPNTAYWRRYRKGKEKPEEIIFFPLQMSRELSEDDGGSSNVPMPYGSVATNTSMMLNVEEKEIGDEEENLNIDLTLKL